MKNILIHGLGQDYKSWNKTQEYLLEKKITVECPNLFDLNSESKMLYQNLYREFCNYCNNQKEKLNLCGLSLGGMLALEYVKEYPEKVNSIILIGTPYEIPRTLFKLQNIIFKFMPNKTFEKIGTTKKDFCLLVNSMSDISISKQLDNIKCKTLIICGMKDKVNRKSARLWNTNITGSDLKIVNNSSHEVNMDNPKELANIIYEFWK